MSVESFSECLAAAKVAVREFNARWNMNAIQLKPVPVRYLFTSEELASLEDRPAWYSAEEAFEAVRKTPPTAVDLTRGGRQLALMYTRAKVSPGPRSYYWVAPFGEKPTATEVARVSHRRGGLRESQR